jgi:hypothetical protein
MSRTKTFAVFTILPVSCVVAAILVPSSPFRWFATAMAIFAVSTSFYVVGKRRQFRAGQAPTAPEDGQQLGRFQFSLGMLFGFVTLAACLIAEITWERQLDRQWQHRIQAGEELLNASAIVARDLKGISVGSSSESRYGCNDTVAHCDDWWAVSSQSPITKALVDSLAGTISDRLCRQDAQADVQIAGDLVGTGVSLEGVISGPCLFGKRIQYSRGPVRGIIVVRFVTWDDQRRNGFLLLIHDQFR